MRRAVPIGRLTTATAVRDGQALTIPASDLVPGDLAVGSAGEPFPADGIVAGGTQMQADESAHARPATSGPDAWPERGGRVAEQR